MAVPPRAAATMIHMRVAGLPGAGGRVAVRPAWMSRSRARAASRLLVSWLTASDTALAHSRRTSAVILGAATFVIERRSEARGEVPLLPPSLLKLPSMSRGLVMVLVFSIGFGAFMFVFALTVQDGLHNDALRGGLAIVPMAALFLLGSLAAPRLISRFGRGALSGGAVVQLAGLAWLVTVLVTDWPHVSLLSMAAPLALVGAGQSMLFAGLFRSVLADVPPHLGGIGSGALITLQQSGLALGVATLGTLYLALAPHSYPRAFATVEGIQMGIVVLLALGAAILPRFTQASADTPVIDA